MPTSRSWIYEWDGAGLPGLTDCWDDEQLDKQLDVLISTCDMTHNYSYHQYVSGFDDIKGIFDLVNSNDANQQITSALHNDYFLVIYDLFSGRSKLKIQNNNCDASFATMCLVVKHDIYRKNVREDGEYTEKNSGLLNSLLLTMVRKPDDCCSRM